MATTAEKLTEARDAYHLLMIGRREVDMWVGRERVTFTAADMDKLRLYIADLEAQVAKEAGQRPAPRRRAVIFGGG